MRSLLFILIMFITGCASIEESCIDLAPGRNWVKTTEPNQEVKSNFHETNESVEIMWFVDNENNYGLCASCDARGNHAYSFEVYSSKNSNMNVITVIGCGY